ncbi:3-(3-hydroxy-phenyl)propionate transporter MhpT [Pseudomonas sp. FSL R10-0056]|uniref:3-(3-hydroxy-phenyl)propionate transporter MhpT n=1 Tax=Pseudomonas TaxID=286 RepID=UPI000BA222CA|nr:MULTISPECIES: 3-(3-hydroxy-phenyl)propionate transporter MhpT [Pseudomonas]MDY7570095.1 3-(3-hydroxy-phenyl)propionate transporter MhpT [Pseudomonas sp. CCC4.1]MEB0143780.1 3-(3-hydroxy-phenyl)propionate transporter MhpT [Pseudomonas sp. CCC4.1]MQT66263.1 3-(3-hydroxy-phenyl)propionate transporter MhpT [Pseudomonas sp. FSL R10-0056]MQT70180.1 3-(3-hydroxy-phenyl)propionate transporter MhpT [Pseudomonas sp. FSL R10-0071]PAA01481.1 3-(3-hydroxy-phenyl)propionate transporter MhpT [Pseudomonas 
MTSLNLQMARTIGLCFLVALMEGLDLQAAGIAAQGMAAAFELDKLHMSWVFSAGIFGLLPGAFAGGWLADRIGRKRVLMASVGLFGVFSLATALAWDINSLLVARCLTGVGLGAALPNLIALTSEVAGPRLRGTAVSLMYCGVPLGAALAALIGIADLAGGWQVVFYVGGVVPLLIVPLLGLYLPESQQFRNVQGEAPIGVVQGLFREGAALPTTLIWVSYFFTLMVVYILINWLPSLVIGQGFTGRQASWVMLALQIGAAAGTLFLGWVMDRLPAWALSALIYVGILVSLTALGLASHLPGMLAAGFIAGFFATGGQCVLYALAPHFYRPSIRATGVGSAVAIGRLGAMSGPLVAGKMLALGTGTAGVMLASAPGIVIAAVAMFYLSVRRNAASPD